MSFLLTTAAQASLTWSNTFGNGYYNWASAAKHTQDGGYIVTSTLSPGFSAVVLKLNSVGGIEWQKSLDVNLAAVEQTEDMGFVATGGTSSIPDNPDLLVIKLSPDGGIIWHKSYGSYNADYGKSIQQTADGGFIVAGHTASYGAGLEDFWLLKLDAMGNIEWQRAMGGVAYDSAEYVRQTADGGYIIAGSTQSFGSGAGDIWMVKTDASGIIQWQKSYGGAYPDYAYAVWPTSEGGYIVSGETQSFGAGNSDLWVLKLNQILSLPFVEVGRTPVALS
jgi:hypothetical protein